MALPGTHLLAAEHDLDGVPPDAQPARSIVVCTASPAASHPVRELLQRCGAGIPFEYFHPAAAGALSRRWRVIHIDDYVAALHHHRSAGTGVFSLVLRWQHLRRLHGRVAGVKPMTADRLMSIITTIAPQPTFLFARDTERDRAAVALYASEHEGGDVAYDPRAIAQCCTLLEAAERAWLQWFEMGGVRPLEVSLRAQGDLEPAAGRIAEALRLTAQAPTPEPSASDPVPAIEQELLRRFRADGAAPAAMPDSALVP